MSFFLEETPQLMLNMEAAILEQNPKTLRLNAHRLKGLVRSYDDLLAEDLSNSLEMKGRENQLEDSKATFYLLGTCITNLTQEIKSYLLRE